MSEVDTMSHLTRAGVEKLPALGDKPPRINTRYVVKSNPEIRLKASDENVRAETWFRTPPFNAHTIRMIRAVKLFAESHDQGSVDDMMQGNWTWFQLAVFSSDKATSPKKGSDGQELVVTSHANRVASDEFEWLEGGTVDTRRIFLQALEPGNVIAVRVCARFVGWEMFRGMDTSLLKWARITPVPIEPIKIDTDDAIPARRNVQTWYNETKTCHETGLELSLFIRAMRVFQSLRPEDQLSYYRIAGIHGFPCNVPWNTGDPVIPLDDPNLEKLLKEKKGGQYCEHNNYLFPTWHRAYMLLYERRISDLMMEEALQRKHENEKWVQAAECWRLPYWDWAAHPSLPDIACDETISVIKSWNGRDEPQMEDLGNPMYRFQMPGLKPMGDSSYGDYRLKNTEKQSWHKCVGTSRHSIKPSDPDGRWVMGESNAEEVNKSLQGFKDEDYQNMTIKDSVFRLLTEQYTTKYVHFSTTRWYEDDPDVKTKKKKEQNPAGDKMIKSYMNLEHLHNNIHWLVGGDDEGPYGHMFSVPVAAFDPVFWLHHCNIDRLLHLWQSANPGNWFHQKKGRQPDRSPQQPLIPFHISGDRGDFYDSNKVRNVDALNYSYDYMDEITDEYGDMIPEKSHLYINKLYGPPENAFKDCRRELDPVINVVYDRYAFNGRAYFLLFFLGDVDRTVSWKKQTCLIGSIYTFTPIVTQDNVVCSNGYEQQKAHVLSRAQIPITRVVPSQKREERDEAKNYLTKNLKWVAVFQDGGQVDGSKLKDVNITLSIGVNQLREDLGRESSFKFEDYQDVEFDWNKAYCG
ncbi:hypothetical protein NHJ6243_008450 [Beauveria neobassiana]